MYNVYQMFTVLNTYKPRSGDMGSLLQLALKGLFNTTGIKSVSNQCRGITPTSTMLWTLPGGNQRYVLNFSDNHSSRLTFVFKMQF